MGENGMDSPFGTPRCRLFFDARRFVAELGSWTGSVCQIFVGRRLRIECIQLDVAECVSVFYCYFRVYSPVAFGKKTDKNGDFIRHWIPKLKNYPKAYIYEPWKAPKRLQKQW